jgi:hypothetical protein
VPTPSRSVLADLLLAARAANLGEAPANQGPVSSLLEAAMTREVGASQEAD